MTLLDTTSFVDKIIQTLKDRSYSPRASANIANESLAPIPSIVGTSTSEYLPHPSHAFSTAPSHAPKGPSAIRASNSKHRLPDRPTGTSSGLVPRQEQGQRSRKRKQIERDTSQPRDDSDVYSSRHIGSDRPVKQTVRRGKNGRAGGLNAQAPAFAPMPNVPPFNPAFGEVPAFDPGNPMAFLAMAAAFGINLPGMPGMPAFNAQGTEMSTVRCADYDTKGFCAAGSVCPYQHGLEYDPDHPAQGVNGGYASQYRHTQGNVSHNGRFLGGRSRDNSSLTGSRHNRTNSTIVVEQIPEENFNEEDVRNFFRKFGNILDVQMQAYKRLAIVKYDTHEAASAAYNSPKVIFENRFVKVYWHRPDTDLGPNRNNYNGFGADSEDISYGDAEILDPEEIEKRQAEAQHAFEERRKKAEAAETKAREIDRKLQETNAEILRVRRELAKASGDTNGDTDEDFSQDLAILQAEAENLFAQQDSMAEPWGGNNRDAAYRGGYRARGHASFMPRGRGRGAYRGHGGYSAPFGGARTRVKRLDNRPRRIAVKDVEPGSRKDEALRQHLFVSPFSDSVYMMRANGMQNVPDVVATEQHPEVPSTLLITFGERYQAESVGFFLLSSHTLMLRSYSSSIPHTRFQTLASWRWSGYQMMHSVVSRIQVQKQRAKTVILNLQRSLTERIRAALLRSRWVSQRMWIWMSLKMRTSGYKGDSNEDEDGPF